MIIYLLIRESEISKNWDCISSSGWSVIVEEKSFTMLWGGSNLKETNGLHLPNLAVS